MTHAYVKRSGLFFLVAMAGMVLAIVSPAGAALQAVGPVSGPHGFPLYYTDINDLSLEPCLDAGRCFFDPVDPNDFNQVTLGIGGEVFWWKADAEAVPLVGGGSAILVLALEGTFGGDESVVNGRQISFGRVRIRVDVPVDGTYTVTHPFGTRVFENVTAADGINYTADIGAANFLDVMNGFEGALQSSIGPFLTWPGYQDDPALQVEIFDENGLPTGNVIQYVGDMNIPHVVTGSPTGNNFFRIDGPGGISTETELFSVMGRVYDGKAAIPHVYPAPPLLNLKDVGPINRLVPFVPGGVVEFVDVLTAGYPLGYPTWYRDHSDLHLTICPGSDPMCISDPIDPNDPAQAALSTGGETFWWAADGAINDRSTTEDPTLIGIVPAGFDALLVLGLEGTFGGDESIVDGQQIAFGRTRIRIDTPVAGEYTVIYPYGMKTFNAPAGNGAINYTADIGVTDPSDPDFAFVGALYSEIGPNFLTWTTFNPDPALNDPLLIKQHSRVNPDGSPVLDANGQPVMVDVHYVGDPATGHEVKGGILVYEGEPVNYFRVIGPGGIDVRTYLFTVQGKVFNPPSAVNDTATAYGAAPVNIDVLENDTFNSWPIDPADATVTLVTNTGNGIAVPNADKTITYTASAGFIGTDTFTYTATVNGQVSNTATVTITVLLAGVNGDFNGDGKPIILWRNTTTGENALWYMTELNGTTVDNYAYIASVSDPAWEIVGAADFNGDGKPDVLWRNITTGVNMLWYMTGLNGASINDFAYLSSVADPAWAIVGAADFDSNGNPDILWRNSNTGDNAVWYMTGLNGATINDFAYLASVADPAWAIAVTADFDSDGKPDILWRNTTTGENVLWYMGGSNGATIYDFAYLASVSDTDWKIAGPK